MAAADQDVPKEVILFEHVNFHGAHKHVFQPVKDLRTAAGETTATQFADKTSSIVVVRGTWEFFEHQNFLGQRWELGPGVYPDIVKQQITPEAISSLRAKSEGTSPPPS